MLLPSPSRRSAGAARAAVAIAAALVMSFLAGVAVLGAPGKDGGAPAEQAAGLLGRRCLQCHNGEKRAGGIDLTTRAGAAAVLSPPKNRLIQAVTTGKMPPTGRLPDAEVALLRRWVAAGAPYGPKPLVEIRLPDQPLWSLEPVRLAPVPPTKLDRLAVNPIDRFVFARLEASGLQPSPPAGRPALLRRVTLDLTGLPPTPDEIAAFLADRSPDAYEKVVDRLLASPHYGERWGQHWLDVVRYGESHGYEQNHIRPNAWPYRDYVIRSFNDDKPYDQFIREQLAGDVGGKQDSGFTKNANAGTSATIDAATAAVGTGFLVAGIHDTVGNQTEEGTRQQRANDLDDMVCATAETFLGLTAGCAKCHDHKFDPIPQKDYYRLAAAFAGVRHGERPVGGGDQSPNRGQAADAERALRALNGKIADLDTEARYAVLRAQGMSSPPRPAVNARRNVEDFPPQSARFVRFNITGTKDGAEPCLDELELYAPNSDANLAIAEGAKVSASSLLPGHRIHQIHHLNDGRAGNEWSWISNERGAGWAQIELPEARTVSRVVWSRDAGLQPRYSDRLPNAYRIEVSEDGQNWRMVSTGEDRAAAPEAIPAGTLQEALTPEQRARRSQLAARVEQLRKQAGAGSSPAAYIGQFASADPIYLLRRGDVMQRGEEVAPGALSRIPGFSGELPWSPADGEPGRRLALARWITDPKNPLTARVMVNRVWHYHFGRGLVGTPSDFGHNGEKPTHPELLDWLAHHFVRRWALGLGPWEKERRSPTPNAQRPMPAWSVKALHRLIVTSYTYRQASDPSERGMAVDAGNRLLWRMPLRRMEAEAIRDAVLAASGKLDRRLGGPPFRLYRYRTVNVAIYEPLEEHGPETWRRSVYRQVARSIRDDLLGSFDCPESAQRTPRREFTTTPLQALSLLNGAFMAQQSAFMAERVEREAGGDRGAQVERAFRLAFGRAPAKEEKEAGISLAEKHGLPSLCRALLNVNEFLYY